jgi:hypothetical protein
VNSISDIGKTDPFQTVPLTLLRASSTVRAEAPSLEFLRIPLRVLSIDLRTFQSEDLIDRSGTTTLDVLATTSLEPLRRCLRPLF